jgi:hypothetical protein
MHLRLLLLLTDSRTSDRLLQYEVWAATVCIKYEEEKLSSQELQWFPKASVGVRREIKRPGRVQDIRGLGKGANLRIGHG